MSRLVDELVWQIKAAGLPEPVRELRFHPSRRWRFDLSWADAHLACEVDGATFVQGRHSRGVGYEKDCEKLAEAVLLGWRVIRVTKHMVEDGRALAFIERGLGK